MIEKYLLPQEAEMIEQLEKEIFSLPWSRSAVESHLHSPVSLTFLEREENRAAGYLMATLVAGEGEILRVGTSPRFRRRGIGQRLVDAFVKEAEKAGAEKIFLEVRAGNLAARRLYEKNGFAVIGIRRDYYSDPAEDAVLYEKIIENNEREENK